MTIKEFLSKITSKIIWCNLAAMALVVAAVAVGVWKGLQIYTLHNTEIEVPNISGISLDNATQILARQDLVAVVTDSSYNAALPASTVTEQTPRAGQKVKPGREIYLVINTAQKPTISMPDIADNSSARQARARLEALGLKLTPSEYIDGEKDWVYNVKCNGRIVNTGQRIPSDAWITLVVGKGYEENDSTNFVNDSAEYIINDGTSEIPLENINENDLLAE